MGRLESKKKSKQYNMKPELHVQEGREAVPLPFNLVKLQASYLDTSHTQQKNGPSLPILITVATKGFPSNGTPIHATRLDSSENYLLVLVSK